MSGPATLQVTLGGETVVLDPRGALVAPGPGAVFVADLHLGKTTLFRRRGLAVPEGGEARDLARLDAVIDAHVPSRLVILGDLVHAAGGLAPDVVHRFSAWRSRHADLDVILVRGNHDRGAGRTPGEWRLEAVDGPVEVAGLACRHEPPADEPPLRRPPTLAGHLHPVVRLREGRGGTGLRPRCFWWRDPVLVLPAFGGFTGGHPVRPRPGDRIFAIPPDEGDGAAVVEVRA